MTKPILYLVAIVLLVYLSACAGLQQSIAPDESVPVQEHEDLDSTLWMQSSAEYWAAARQAYRLAEVQLDRGLTDANWTAAIQQEQLGDYHDLPPADVLDIDETVLNNTAYQARLMLEDATYDSESWDTWVNEEAAVPIPGAAAFTQYAQAQGVTVFYVTNRSHDLEEATLANLAAYHFAIDPTQDVILTPGEMPAWEGTDKRTRRLAIAERYRILLLIGDSLGDFVSDGEETFEERNLLAQSDEGFWGERWIVLPNPVYGSWEDALIDFDYSLSAEERLELKYEALDAADESVDTSP